MEIKKEKYINAVLFFINNCDNHLGITKLNKLFYYLDFVSYKDKKTTVTNDQYIHQEYGPVAASLETEILPHMKENGLISIENILLASNKRKILFKTEVDADLSVFDVYEKELLRKICDKFCNYSTQEIVDQTHTEAPYYYSEFMSIMDFENAEDIDILEDVK